MNRNNRNKDINKIRCDLYELTYDEVLVVE
jgi:hypothetical protein